MPLLARCAAVGGRRRLAGVDEHVLAVGPPAVDEHTDVLVFQAYPYASIYLGAEGMLGGKARDRIAGFWRALGGEPPAEPTT